MTKNGAQKEYDRAYFERWYRRDRVGGARTLARKVSVAVSMAEYFLQRPIRSVLDIGCGEGAWRAPLLRIRPNIDYLGFDASQYAVLRYGARRNVRFARFSDFEALRPCPPADLLICSDVLHYLKTRELDRGLPGVVSLCGGVAFLETFTREDDVEGDKVAFQARTAAFYRRRFSRLGLRALGAHCWLSPALANAVAVASLESASPTND